MSNTEKVYLREYFITLCACDACTREYEYCVTDLHRFDGMELVLLINGQSKSDYMARIYTAFNRSRLATLFLLFYTSQRHHGLQLIFLYTSSIL